MDIVVNILGCIFSLFLIACIRNAYFMLGGE